MSGSLRTIPSILLTGILPFGAIFVEYASWPWVFYFIAIVAIPIGGICSVIIPKPSPKADDHSAGGWWKRFDFVGVFVLTGELDTKRRVHND